MIDAQKQLAIFGLSEREITVYLVVLQHGKITATQLAHATKINRTTIYSLLKTLLRRGFVAEDRGTPTRQYVATPLEELPSVLLKSEEDALQEKHRVLEDLIKKLNTLSQKAEYSIPKIQFVTEDRLENFLYQRSPVWDESVMSRGKQYWGFQEKAFVEKYSDWVDWYWKRAPKELEVFIISNESLMEKAVASKGYERRHIAFWKNSVRFVATTWVMGDYVVMFVVSSQPNYLVEIHDATFAENFRQIIKGIWEDIHTGKI